MQDLIAINEEGRASQAPAGDVDQREAYGNPIVPSTEKPLEQVADVLCLLAFFPLGPTARVGLFALFERRLGRAYGGPSHE